MQILQELQRLHMAWAVDQRRHVGRIEPVDIVMLIDLVARRHGKGSGEGLEVIVPLLADLQMQHHAAVGIGVVVVPVLAVEVTRDVAQLLPGGRRGPAGRSHIRP